MAKLTLSALGSKVATKRGARGIRETAKEIGTSPATLSRIERGHLPDLETFRKICQWLVIDPGEVLGIKPLKSTRAPILVQFKKDATVSPETARALAEMVLAAQRALEIQERNGV